MDNSIRGGWYQQILAFDGMLNRSIKRVYFKNSKSLRYMRRFREDVPVQISIKDGKVTRAEYDTTALPVQRFNSICEFFNSIRYDYKNKKVSYTDSKLIIPLSNL